MTLQVQAQGSGPNLVLLHGWSMNAAIWRDLGAVLARSFRVHAVDLTDCGDNAVVACEMLAAAVPSRVTVCGWSLGGQLALAWAHLHPAQVERLVLLATTPRFVRNAEWTHGMTIAGFEEFAGAVALDASRALRRFRVLQADGDAAEREVLRALLKSIALGGVSARSALISGLEFLRTTDLRAALPSIMQPALVMHGVNDAVIPHAAGEYLARMLPHGEFASVPHAGHAIFVTREATTAQRIREFHGRR
jgi:pimeloyl-[acyl-carrier protein] methyl ester esterase